MYAHIFKGAPLGNDNAAGPHNMSGSGGAAKVTDAQRAGSKHKVVQGKDGMYSAVTSGGTVAASYKTKQEAQGRVDKWIAFDNRPKKEKDAAAGKVTPSRMRTITEATTDALHDMAGDYEPESPMANALSAEVRRRGAAKKSEEAATLGARLGLRN